MKSKQPFLSIVVLGFSPWPALQTCIESLVKHTPVSNELILVGNICDPILRRHFTKRNNFRLAQTVNSGIIEATGEYFCLCIGNPVVRSGWFTPLLNILKQPLTGGILLRSGQKNNFCFLLPRAVMGCVGTFNEQVSLDSSIRDYWQRLKKFGYRRFQLKSKKILPSKAADAALKKKHPVLTPKKETNSIKAIEWRVRQYLFSRHKKQAIPPDPDCGSLTAPPGIFRPVRTSFPIQFRDGKQIKFLVCLSSLEMFKPNLFCRRLWNFLDGSRSLEQIAALLAEQSSISKKQIRLKIKENINALSKENMVTEINVSRVRFPLVTVMMPAHNAARWISQAIESVLTQTYRSFELIIIDDGSTDRTFEIAGRYLWDPRVRLFQNQIQQGIAKTRNKILDLAKGKYIAVCDADDVMRPGLLARFAGLLEKYSDVGWIYAERLKIDDSGRPLRVDPVLPDEGPNKFRRNIVASAGGMLRKSEMIKAGGYNEALLSTEDYVLAVRMAKHTRFLAVPGEIHYLWRQHRGSISRTNPWSAREPKQWITEAALQLKRT